MNRPTARLYAESFAPWCEKARWALDHHGIAYESIEHVPLLGELTLRFVARRPLGRVTVPMLVVGHERLLDSLSIALFAERAGTGPALFPSGNAIEIMKWNSRSERIMAAGRALLLLRMTGDVAALSEQLPGWIVGETRERLSVVARLGVRYLMHKYDVRAEEREYYEAALRDEMRILSAALAHCGAHLAGEALTYADVSIGAALQFVQPVEDRYIRLGPATRAAWTHGLVAQDHREVLRWRDRLYAAHRRAQ